MTRERQAPMDLDDYDREPQYMNAVPTYREYLREPWLKQEEQAKGMNAAREALQDSPAYVAGFLREVRRWVTEYEQELTPEAEAWLAEQARKHLDEMEGA